MSPIQVTETWVTQASINEVVKIVEAFCKTKKFKIIEFDGRKLIAKQGSKIVDTILGTGPKRRPKKIYFLLDSLQGGTNVQVLIQNEPGYDPLVGKIRYKNYFTELIMVLKSVLPPIPIPGRIKICPSCNAEVNENNKYCFTCGFEF